MEDETSRGNNHGGPGGGRSGDKLESRGVGGSFQLCKTFDPRFWSSTSVLREPAEDIRAFKEHRFGLCKVNMKK